MDHQAARVADIGQVREQLHAVDELPAPLVAALNSEGEDRTAALGQVLPRQRAVRARWE